MSCPQNLVHYMGCYICYRSTPSHNKNCHNRAGLCCGSRSGRNRILPDPGPKLLTKIRICCTQNFQKLKKLVRENLFCLKFLRCSINNLFPFFKFLRKTFTCYVLQVLTFKYRSRSRIIFDRIRSTASGYYNYYRNVPT